MFKTIGYEVMATILDAYLKYTHEVRVFNMDA